MRDGVLNIKVGFKIRRFIMNKKEVIKKLNEQEFYELLQQYRHLPIADQEDVIKAFEDIKQFIIKLLKIGSKQGDIIMKKYKIHYYFDGNGEVLVEAENEDEAREMFFSGEIENEDEWGDQYSIKEVEELKE